MISGADQGGYVQIIMANNKKGWKNKVLLFFGRCSSSLIQGLDIILVEKSPRMSSLNICSNLAE